MPPFKKLDRPTRKEILTDLDERVVEQDDPQRLGEGLRAKQDMLALFAVFRARFAGWGGVGTDARGSG